MASIGRALSILSRLGVPQLRRSAPTTTTSPVGRVLFPAIQEAQGNVVYESSEPAVPLLAADPFAPTIPSSIEMLTTNSIAVQPGLLLDAFPWQSLLDQPPQRVASGEGASQDIAKLYADLLRWKDLGHLVNPQQAVDICKKFATWMSLRDIERVLTPKHEGSLDAVRQVLSNDLDVDKYSQRHAQILTLLKEDRVHEAYLRSQSALRSLDSAHRLIDSACLRVMEAQRRVSEVKWKTWAAAGTCVVLGLACEYLAAVPEVSLPAIESVLQSAAISGTVLCISAVTALYLSSDRFSSYMNEIRDAREAHLRVRMKLEEDINTCLDQGYLPQA